MGRVFFTVISSSMLMSCLPDTIDTFEVNSEPGQLVSGVLQLCGETKDMHLTETGLRLSHAISCEGTGSIEVRTSSGEAVTCNVSYVAPGADSRLWRFRVDQSRCVNIS